MEKGFVGSSLLKTIGNNDIFVITPANHYSNKKYPLLVVYAPAGKSAKKSEKFYKKISSEFTLNGYLIAFVGHRALSEKAIIDNRSVVDIVKRNYCISDEISLLGHSDGATVSGIIAYRDNSYLFKNIIMSANGLNKKALENESCPKNSTSFLILHNKKDILFPNYGTDNFNWLKKCYSCDIADVLNFDKCITPVGCNGKKIEICYNDFNHQVWPDKISKIINFIREE